MVLCRTDERQRDTTLRELFDDEYLPTAKEQLAHCRSQQQLAMLSSRSHQHLQTQDHSNNTNR